MNDAVGAIHQAKPTKAQVRLLQAALADPKGCARAWPAQYRTADVCVRYGWLEHRGLYGNPAALAPGTRSRFAYELVCLTAAGRAVLEQAGRHV